MILPLSTGGLLAVRAETGRVLWTESLAGGQRSESLSQLADIRGRPVIDRDLVIAVSHSGNDSGDRSHQRAAHLDGTISAAARVPGAAGDYIYMLTREGDVLCLTREPGSHPLVQLLPTFENMEDKRRPIYLVRAGSRG